jgi:hypothetical protein
MHRACLAFAAALVLFTAPPARALDLFARHEVTAHFATPDGRPMADAAVRVFAPGDLRTPVLTGQTDKAGNFVFTADRDGFWSAEARIKGEVARVMIRVGGGDGGRGAVPPALLLGGLALLLVLAFGWRVMRLRAGRGRKRR